ncbi:MAG: DMT family transporter [Rhodoferax sp.]|uniref:DMT family transporter n=1 Tax=Rhodoferax sp. TaxID=50421 RepID=UPI002625BD90|nr:DMT family transporter [Rhodoferax sp.]MDD5335954.1 DMT family transporter [Rhodoferax sp.]
MHPKLSPGAALLLTLPPLLWAGNAVLGRLLSPLVSPLTLNFLRWSIAFILLLPLAGAVLRPGHLPRSAWRRFSLLGLLSVGSYNALLYLALDTSTPLNVTLVGSSTPVWMLLIGRLFFRVPVSPRQLLGALLSISGVLLVMCRGQLELLAQLRPVAGDLYMLMAAAAWAYYSWMLAHPTTEPPAIRSDWSAFLLAQVTFGLFWSGLFAGGEWALGKGHVQWGWPMAAALLFVAVGPGLIAFRAWGAGVAWAGPAAAGFFANLTPLFTALLSSAFLGQVPQFYHLLAFLLIMGGIVVSSRR